MPNYTIPPRSKPSDYAKGKMTQDEIIAIQIANDANIAKARKAIKNGEPAQLTATQTMSPEEALLDASAQEATARTNLEKLGFRPQEAAAITAEMRINNDIGFVPFNTNYPAIEADIKKRFNPKLLTAAFFIEYLRNYIVALDGANGIRVYQPFNGGFNNMIDNVAELRALLPPPAIIMEILGRAQAQYGVNQDILGRLNQLAQMLPTEQGLRALENLDPVRQQMVIDQLLEQFRDLPPAEEFMALRGMIRGDQIDREDFRLRMRDIVDAIPRGRQENIVNAELNLAGVRDIVREELANLPRYPSGGKSRGDDGSASGGRDDESSLVAESRSGIADIFEESAGERKARLRREEREEVLRQERLQEQRLEATDRQLAATIYEMEQAYSRKYRGMKVQDIPPEAIAAIPNIQSPDISPRVRQFYRELVAAASGSAAPRPSAPSISDLTDTSGTSSLSSSLSITAGNRQITKEELKATFDANPEFKDRLTYRGVPFNWNDIQLTQPANPNSRKKWINDPDLNLVALMRAKFGSGLTRAQVEGKPQMRQGNGVMNGYTFLGQGVKQTIRKKMMVGRGIAVKETPSYKEYGKYAIHIPQLEQQDLLNVKYKSLGQVPKFKPIPVSDIFRDFMLDLLENGKPNSRVYHQICPKERKVFEEMSIGAGVWNGLGLKRTTTSDDEDEAKRFELLKGEYIAGNNNPKVISELRRLVVKMMSDGRIRKAQGLELLMELSI